MWELFNMKREEMFVVLTGFLFVCVKDFITTSGYKQFIENSVILMAVIAAFIVQQYVLSGKANLFRLGDAGLWACLLLPSVANGMEIEDKSLLWTLALATFVSCVYSEGLTMSRSWCMFVVVVYTCLTANLIYHKPLDALIIAICCGVYMYVLYNISSWFKKSFTFGESSVVVQLFVCQTYRCIRNVKGSDPLEKVTVMVYMGLQLVVLSLYVLSKKGCPALWVWPVVVVIGLVYLLTMCVLYLELTDIHRILNNVVATHVSAVLLCWWFIWLISSVMLVCFHGNTQSKVPFKKMSCSPSEMSSKDTPVYEHVTPTQSCDETQSDGKYKQILNPEMEEKTTDISKISQSKNSKKSKEKMSGNENATAVRKFFHVAMICVYVPGLMLSPSLLYLASITIAAVLIILEVIRVLKLQSFGSMLDEYLWVFLDEQDTGDLILTPIYLLLGCSLPLWWNYKQQRPPCSLSMYAGLISVGVGDAIASVCGRKYGRHKWPGRKKSIEGTTAAFIAQIIAIQLLSFGNIPGAVVSMETIFCVALISLLEALTNQIDNLVVPMFAWVLLATIEPTY